MTPSPTIVMMESPAFDRGSRARSESGLETEDKDAVEFLESRNVLDSVPAKKVAFHGGEHGEESDEKLGDHSNDGAVVKEKTTSTAEKYRDTTASSRNASGKKSLRRRFTYTDSTSE